MKSNLLFVPLFLLLFAPVSHGQSTNTLSSTRAYREPSSPAFFPHNWIRGFVDAGFAPSHNEPDLGRCSFPQKPGPGGRAPSCHAYARFLTSGYLKIQPINRTVARHLFLFFEPRFSFGNNVPQI